MRPFRKLIPARTLFLGLLEGILAGVCYLIGTFIDLDGDASFYLMYEDGLQQLAVCTAALLVASYLLDYYRDVHTRSRLVLLLQATHLIGVTLMIDAAVAFLKRDLIAPARIVLIGSALAILVLWLWRIFLRPAVWKGIGAQTVLFVGTGAAVDRLAEAFRDEPALGTEVRGYVADSASQVRPAPLLGGYHDLVRIVSTMNPDRIIVGGERLSESGVLTTLFNLRSSGVEVESAADAYEAIFSRICSRAVEPYAVIFRNELSAGAGSVALQSIYTNVLGLVTVIALTPLLTVIAIVSGLAGNYPVLDKQMCVGLHGIPFTRYRFNCNKRQGFARFMRKYKLDALPEILNLLRGEMALIGPRAERIEFSEILEDLIPFYRQKYTVKPGIIGWSQLHCDATGAPEDTIERIEYDLYYIKHMSLVLDAYVLVRGVKWMLADKDVG